MENDNNKPATKADLANLQKDFKAFILEREVVSMRWMIGIQITYFFGTLAAVWFMVSHLH
jgi:hypothetical protein